MFISLNGWQKTESKNYGKKRAREAWSAKKNAASRLCQVNFSGHEFI